MNAEQLIKVKAPAISWLYRIVLIIACVLAATTVPTTGVMGIIILIAFLIVTVLVFEYYNAEIEYSFYEDVLSVDRIMGKTTRRHMGSYAFSRAKLVAYADSEEAMRLQHSNVHTYDYLGRLSDREVVVCYVYDDATNEEVRLYIEPDEKILEAIEETVAESAYKISEK